MHRAASVQTRRHIANFSQERCALLLVFDNSHDWLHIRGVPGPDLDRTNPSCWRLAQLGTPPGNECGSEVVGGGKLAVGSGQWAVRSGPRGLGRAAEVVPSRPGSIG